MADLTQTAASVLLVSGSKQTGVAGGSITAGYALYQDSTTTPATLKAALSDSQAHAAFVGIALNSATTGQPVTYATPGSIVNLGAALTIGQIYVVSANAGHIAPDSDWATGNWCAQVGQALTAANCYITGFVLGAAHA